MKRFAGFLGSALLVALICCVVNVQAASPMQKVPIRTWTSDTLATGTSADTITSFPLNIGDLNYLGAYVKITVTTGGGAGAAAIYFQGRVGTGSWENIYACIFTDSLQIAQSFAISSTASIEKYFTLSVQPWEANGEAVAGNGLRMAPMILPGMNMPYTEIRCYVLDTNWTAGAKLSGSWLYKK